MSSWEGLHPLSKELVVWVCGPIGTSSILLGFIRVNRQSLLTSAEPTCLRFAPSWFRTPFRFPCQVDPSDNGHEGAGAFTDEVFVLDTESLRWLRPDVRTEVGAKQPCARGWFAFAPIGRSMFVYGGNSVTNERLDDLHLLTVSAT